MQHDHVLKKLNLTKRPNPGGGGGGGGGRGYAAKIFATVLGGGRGYAAKIFATVLLYFVITLI